MITFNFLALSFYHIVDLLTFSFWIQTLFFCFHFFSFFLTILIIPTFPIQISLVFNIFSSSFPLKLSFDTHLFHVFISILNISKTYTLTLLIANLLTFIKLNSLSFVLLHHHLIQFQLRYFAA